MKFELSKGVRGFLSGAAKYLAPWAIPAYTIGRDVVRWMRGSWPDLGSMDLVLRVLLVVSVLWGLYSIAAFLWKLRRDVTAVQGDVTAVQGGVAAVKKALDNALPPVSDQGMIAPHLLVSVPRNVPILELAEEYGVPRLRLALEVTNVSGHPLELERLVVRVDGVDFHSVERRTFRSEVEPGLVRADIALTAEQAAHFRAVAQTTRDIQIVGNLWLDLQGLRVTKGFGYPVKSSVLR